MPQKFTTEDLIALLYNELNTEAKEELLALLKTDERLQREYNELAETIGTLSEAEEDASPTSVKMIMEYSAKSKARKLQHV